MMATVLSEGELQSNNTFDGRILLSSLIDLADLWISAIERLIEETVNNLTDTAKQWLRLGVSFLHLISSMAGLVIDIIRNNIASLVVSCGKMITSIGKFLTTMDQLINGTEHPLLSYEVTRNIHDILTAMKFGMKGIELAYSARPRREIFEPLYENEMNSQPTLPESGRSRRREPPPIVSSASYFDFAPSSGQQSARCGSEVKERRPPSPTNG